MVEENWNGFWNFTDLCVRLICNSVPYSAVVSSSLLIGSLTLSHRNCNVIVFERQTCTVYILRNVSQYTLQISNTIQGCPLVSPKKIKLTSGLTL